MLYTYPEVEALQGSDLVGTHSCVALVQHYAKLPHTSMWKEGEKVVGNKNLKKGTAIATFVDGLYPNQSSGNHAGLFISHTPEGFLIMDQWKGKVAVKSRPLRAKGKLQTGGYIDPSNNSEAFSVIN